MKEFYTHISLELGSSSFRMLSIWKSLYHIAVREAEEEQPEKTNFKKK